MSMSMFSVKMHKLPCKTPNFLRGAPPRTPLGLCPRPQDLGPHPEHGPPSVREAWCLPIGDAATCEDDDEPDTDQLTVRPTRPSERAHDLV